MSDVSLQSGMVPAQIRSILGEPDRITYIQISFRPPDASEDPAAYQRELEHWKAVTVGEMWRYDNANLLLKLTKAGALLTWEEAQQ